MKDLQSQIKKMIKEHNIPKSSRSFAKKWKQAGLDTVTFDTDDVIPDSKGNLSVIDVSTPEKAKAAGLKGRAYSNASDIGADAFKKELGKLADESVEVGSMMNKMLTKT